jgi:hypothetical protein
MKNTATGLLTITVTGMSVGFLVVAGFLMAVQHLS